MNKSQTLAMVLLLIAGVAIGSWIMTAGDSAQTAARHADHAGHAEETVADASAPVKGSKGGKLFTENGFGLEVTIFEDGVPPQFRLYLYQDGKPLAPNAATVSLSLSRLGQPAQPFRFTPEASYLLGDQEVVEPHSFDVAISAEYQGKTYQWHYSQVEARVQMADAALASSGIQLRTAGPATIRPMLKLPGEIKFNSERLVRVVPRAAGVVVADLVTLGQTVKKGEILAVMESQSLAEMRSQLMAASKRLDLAKTTYQRERQLWQEKITAEQDYLAAAQAMSEAEIERDLARARLRAMGASASNSGNLTRYAIRAPIAGLVVSKDLALGDSLQADTGIYTIADNATVWAEVTVYPKDLNVIKLGQSATVKATAFNATAQGTVSHVGALVGEQTRTATARIVLDNAAGQWRPGMFFDVMLQSEAIEVPVAVSLDALQNVRDWTVVFGRYGDAFEARPLTLGRRDAEYVEVLQGLAAGEKYAAGNSFAIKADIGKSGATHDH